MITTMVAMTSMSVTATTMDIDTGSSPAVTAPGFAASTTKTRSMSATSTISPAVSSVSM